MLLLHALLLYLPALAQPVAKPSDTVMIDEVHIIDPASGELERDRAILIRDGRVTDVLAAGTATSALRIDARGAFATPGLWDSHVHALGDTDDALNRLLPLMVAYGVTHARDMGSNLERLTTVRAAIATDPQQVAPYLLASGPLLMERELRWYGDIQRAIGGAGDPNAAVDELAAAGVDFLKAYSGLRAESYAALMTAAREKGLAVDGHVPDSVGIVGVVDAGQRTIEHLDISAFLTCAGGPEGPYGDHLTTRFDGGMEAHMQNLTAFLGAVDWDSCGPALERLGARGGALTPTLSMEIRERAFIAEYATAYVYDGGRAWCLQGLGEIDAVPESVRRATYAALFETLGKVRSRQVTILAGTDAPNHCMVPGLSLWNELSLLNRAGLSPLEVLQTATSNPGRTFGRESRIATGETADIVLWRDNPLEKVSALRRPVGVYHRGRWLDTTQLMALRNAGRVVGQDMGGDALSEPSSTSQ